MDHGNIDKKVVGPTYRQGGVVLRKQFWKFSSTKRQRGQKRKLSFLAAEVAKASILGFFIDHYLFPGAFHDPEKFQSSKFEECKIFVVLVTK